MTHLTNCNIWVYNGTIKIVAAGFYQLFVLLGRIFKKSVLYYTLWCLERAQYNTGVILQIKILTGKATSVNLELILEHVYYADSRRFRKYTQFLPLFLFRKGSRASYSETMFKKYYNSDVLNPYLFKMFAHSHLVRLKSRKNNLIISNLKFKTG